MRLIGGGSTASEELGVEVRELSDMDLTPATAYRALRRCGDPAILVAGRAGADPAYVGLDPLETLTFDDDPTMLERIRTVFDRYRRALATPPPGYGVVAAFAYDAALALHGVPVRRRPRGDRLFGDAYAFVPGTWLSFDPHGSGVKLSGIFRTPAERSATQKRLDAYVRRLSSTAPATGEIAPLFAATWRRIEASLSRRSFLARVAKAQRAIGAGDVYQLVVGIRFSCEYGGGDALAVFERLTAWNPSPYAFLIERDGRALAGASPEFLVRLEGDRAQLRPLAGTRPRGTTAERDDRLADELLADVKERAEHVMLVDLGRNDLSRVCRVGSVRVDRALEVERYSHVMHLASSVSGRLREGRDAFDVFGAAFPAGTVTGTPKRRAMELIAELEPTARDAYAGSVAHFRLDGSMDAALTLRSIALCNGRAVWQAAAGIVHRSDPASEYAEVLAKTRIARTVLGVPEPSLG